MPKFSLSQKERLEGCLNQAAIPMMVIVGIFGVMTAGYNASDALFKNKDLDWGIICVPTIAATGMLVLSAWYLHRSDLDD